MEEKNRSRWGDADTDARSAEGEVEEENRSRWGGAEVEEENRGRWGGAKAVVQCAAGMGLRWRWRRSTGVDGVVQRWRRRWRRRTGLDGAVQRRCPLCCWESRRTDSGAVWRSGLRSVC